MIISIFFYRILRYLIKVSCGLNPFRFLTIDSYLVRVRRFAIDWPIGSEMSSFLGDITGAMVCAAVASVGLNSEVASLVQKFPKFSRVR